MTLLSPLEDFSLRTMAHLDGNLARLRYLAELRDPGGYYHHWGLEREFTEETVNEVVQQAHEESFLQILEMSVEELQIECAKLDSAYETETTAAVQGKEWIPASATPAMRLHFSSVLFALRVLVEADRPADPNRRGA